MVSNWHRPSDRISPREYAVVVPARPSILPLDCRGQDAIRPPFRDIARLVIIQTGEELLNVIPGYLLHRAVRVAQTKAARRGTESHHYPPSSPPRTEPALPHAHLQVKPIGQGDLACTGVATPSPAPRVDVPGSTQIISMFTVELSQSDE